ncbi:MAG: hypothetical protein LBQ24_00800 [Candidatus Peribacteria bacterium]|jgi:ribosomal protein L14E/L6E/L27E|nr:hypothetical protein [Candidatus Peribacteria bacterium]
MEDIFEEADIEEFMYKYSKKLPTDHKMSIKEALNFIKFNANLSEAEKIVLKEIENKN